VRHDSLLRFDGNVNYVCNKFLVLERDLSAAIEAFELLIILFVC